MLSRLRTECGSARVWLAYVLWAFFWQSIVFAVAVSVCKCLALVN